MSDIKHSASVGARLNAQPQNKNDMAGFNASLTKSVSNEKDWLDKTYAYVDNPKAAQLSQKLA